MLLRLLILFTVVPLLELWLLMEIGERIGLLATIALILATGVLGASLARWQGLLCLQTAQRQVRSGRLPTDSLLEGLAILVAAALLVTPGVLTDLVGFALLIPPLRRRISRAISKLIRARIETISFTTGERATDNNATHTSDHIIDVRVIDPSDDESPDGNGPLNYPRA